MTFCRYGHCLEAAALLELRDANVARLEKALDEAVKALDRIHQFYAIGCPSCDDGDDHAPCDCYALDVREVTATALAVIRTARGAA